MPYKTGSWGEQAKSRYEKRRKSGYWKNRVTRQYERKLTDEENRNRWGEYRRKLDCIGKNNPFYNRKHTEKSKELMSNSRKGRYGGDKNPNWKGGKSFEPYPIIFNKQLKDRVRVRDNFICQLCKIPELECYRRLSVHHIDYDKRNCDLENLTSLCIKCNSKVNYNREYWEKYFMRGGERIQC